MHVQRIFAGSLAVLFKIFVGNKYEPFLFVNVNILVGWALNLVVLLYILYVDSRHHLANLENTDCYIFRFEMYKTMTKN